MRGLLLKDYYLIKSAVWMMAVLILPLALLQLFLFQRVFLSLAPLLFSILFYLLANNTFSIDDSSKWNKISVTFPITPQTLVGEKYILHLLSILFGTALGVAVNGMGTLIKPDFQTGPYFLHIVILGVLMPLLAGAVNLPLCCLFGKSSVLMPVFLILSYVPAAAAGFAVRAYITASGASGSLGILFAALAGAAACYILSFCLCVRAFTKRDV